jgi:hypothetical protein
MEGPHTSPSSSLAWMPPTLLFNVLTSKSAIIGQNCGTWWQFGRIHDARRNFDGVGTSRVVRVLRFTIESTKKNTYESPRKSFCVSS